MDILFSVNAVLGILSLVYLFLLKKTQYWEKRNVPFVKPELFYGNARGVSKKFHSSKFTQNMYIKLKPLGPIGGVYMYTRTTALVTDLDLMKSILVKDFNVFTNRGSYFNEKDDPLSAHLVNLEDDPWRNLRHKLSPTFTSGKIKMMFETISEIADRLIVTIEKETKATGQLEVKDVLSRFTTDVIGSTSFGIECNSLEDKTTKFYEIGLKAFSSFNFFKRAFLQTYRDLARKLHMTSTNKEVGDFYIGVVRETLEYRKKNPQIQRNDFMNLLINLKDSGVLTFNQIAAQSVSFDDIFCKKNSCQLSHMKHNTLENVLYRETFLSKQRQNQRYKNVNI